MFFDWLSDFQYFSADTNPIFRYLQIFESLTLAHSVKYAISASWKEDWRRGAVISVEVAVFNSSTLRSNAVRT